MLSNNVIFRRLIKALSLTYRQVSELLQSQGVQISAKTVGHWTLPPARPLYEPMPEKTFQLFVTCITPWLNEEACGQLEAVRRSTCSKEQGRLLWAFAKTVRTNNQTLPTTLKT